MTCAHWVGPYKLGQILKHGLDVTYDLALSTCTLTLTSAWISGFTDADGCFDIGIRRCGSCVLGFRVELRITYSQRHPQVLEKLRSVFGASRVTKDKGRHAYRLSVSGQSRLRDVVSPYFDNHPPYAKRDQYKLWRRALVLVLRGGHRQPGPDLDEILSLRSRLRLMKKPPVSRVAPRNKRLGSEVSD